MSFEHDDEATVFDPAPWGAQPQWVSLPAMPRVSGPLQTSSIAPVPSLAGAALVGVSLADTTLSISLAGPSHAGASLPVASTAIATMDRTVQSCAPAQLISKARVAAPIAALVAVLAIASGYVMRSSHKPAPLSGAAALSVEPSTPILRLSAPVPAVEPVAAPAAETAALIEIEEDDVVERRALAAKPRPARKAKSSTKRPRRIVAGDVSTPLGDLRPRKAW